MDNTQRDPVLAKLAGEWYLRGFLDGYDSCPAVVPHGPAGAQYKKGFTEGVEAALRDSFAATWHGFRDVTPSLNVISRPAAVRSDTHPIR